MPCCQHSPRVPLATANSRVTATHALKLRRPMVRAGNGVWQRREVCGHLDRRCSCSEDGWSAGRHSLYRRHEARPEDALWMPRSAPVDLRRATEIRAHPASACALAGLRRDSEDEVVPRCRLRARTMTRGRRLVLCYALQGVCAPCVVRHGALAVPDLGVICGTTTCFPRCVCTASMLLSLTCVCMERDLTEVMYAVSLRPVAKLLAIACPSATSTTPALHRAPGAQSVGKVPCYIHWMNSAVLRTAGACYF